MSSQDNIQRTVLPIPDQPRTGLELAFVFIRPFFGDVMRGEGRTRREVNEEWLIGE